ncbi:MAG TPA: SBBP repeat-containing protein, partial [Chitinophagaceae bacterium]|nr:SBBP repeat-containing protein [Chitinophagaceae bacterium]
VDGSGNVCVTGVFQGTVDFDPGAGTVSLTSAGSYDVLFAKYDADGNYVYAKALGGTGSDFGNGIAVDGSGNVYVTGYFSGTADFDPGAGTANIISAGTQDIFFAKYDASGNYVYAKALGGTGGDYSNDIALDGSGNVYVTGYFNGTGDFDPGAGTANLTSAGNNDLFFAKYDASGNYVYAKAVGGTGYDIGYRIVVDGGG